jgi:hypothetical protein
VRTIIAGSRGITDINEVVNAVSGCLWMPSVVLSGCARGVDKLGEQWAAMNDVVVERYPADWVLHGMRSAGRIRNVLMAERAEALIAVWDGVSPGTRHMIRVARNYGLLVAVFSR